MDFLAFSVNKLNHHYSLQCPWMQSLKISVSRCSTLLGSVFRNVLYFKPSFVFDHPVSWAILWMCLWHKIWSCVIRSWVIWSWVIWSYQTFQLLDLHWALLNAVDWVSDLIWSVWHEWLLHWATVLLATLRSCFPLVTYFPASLNYIVLEIFTQPNVSVNCSKSLQHDLGNSAGVSIISKKWVFL